MQLHIAKSSPPWSVVPREKRQNNNGQHHHRNAQVVFADVDVCGNHSSSFVGLGAETVTVCVTVRTHPVPLQTGQVNTL